jgi:large subunit ribosomal protein L25
MAKQTELAASLRKVTGKATKQLRAQGILPATLFGQGAEPQSIQVTALDFERLRLGRHTSGVVMLKIADTQQVQTTFVRHVQHHPLSGKILHIDFFRINLKEKITAKVALHFEGVAPSVKLGGGVLLHLLETLDVECAAGDIVQFLTVDISHLEKIDDMLLARDIALPPNYTLVADPEEPVVKITSPRAEKGAAPAAQAPGEEQQRVKGYKP